MATSQESLVHGSLSLQFSAMPGAHLLLTQASPLVHALLSLHGALLALNWQPSVLSQTSSVHGLLSKQTSTAPDWQLPPAQASPLVHALLSLQATVLLAFWQPRTALHVSVVQALPSSQLLVAGGLPQVPALQVAAPW